MVTRYQFSQPVPEWMRVMWASEELRAKWQPRIHAVQRAWAKAELGSVGRFRAACLTTIAPEQLALFANEQRPNIVLILGQTARVTSYQSSTAAARPGQPFDFRVAVVMPEAVEGVNDAWYGKQADSDISRFLGFPRCCAEFFDKTWGDEDWRDTTWPMAQGATEVSGPAECNILWRWMGLRWVPHLPCSFKCPSTFTFAQHFRALMPAQEAVWLDEILGWSAEWSAWHGIAEIKTPILKISTKTDPTVEKLVVRRPGSYPADGPRGMVFPYRPEIVKANPHAPRLNGFPSDDVQNVGHELVLNALRSAPPATGALVTDLGCGTGLLLERVKGEYPNVQVLGVESDRTKRPTVAHVYGDVGDLDFGKADTFLVSLRRFEEHPTLESRVQARCRQYVAYSYDAPLSAEVRPGHGL